MFEICSDLSKTVLEIFSIFVNIQKRPNHFFLVNSFKKAKWQPCSSSRMSLIVISEKRSYVTPKGESG